MSSDPLLNKMDALLKKHRVDGETAPASVAPKAGEDPPPLPDDAWLPVLTEVVDVGDLPAESEPSPARVSATESSSPVPTIDPDELARAIMAKLEPQLDAMVREQFVAQIRDSLSSTLSTLLRQMDSQIKETVRETVAEHLGKP